MDLDTLIFRRGVRVLLPPELRLRRRDPGGDGKPSSARVPAHSDLLGTLSLSIFASL